MSPKELLDVPMLLQLPEQILHTILQLAANGQAKSERSFADSKATRGQQPGSTSKQCLHFPCLPSPTLPKLLKHTTQVGGELPQNILSSATEVCVKQVLARRAVSYGRMLGRARNLKSLDLRNDPKVVTPAFSQAAEPGLAKLAVLKMQEVNSPQALQIILRACRHTLEELQLRRSSGAIGQGLCLKQLTGLRVLDISWSQSVCNSYDWVETVLPHLTHIDITGCENLHDIHFDEAVCLEVLRAGYSGLQDRDLISLAKGAPKLKALYLATNVSNTWIGGLYSIACLKFFINARPDVSVKYVV